MKIAILTQPLGFNYGGILQNYALQTVLRELGHECITLDYRPRYPIWQYVLSVCKTTLLFLNSKRSRRFFPYPKIKKRADNIDSFMKTHICLTPVAYKYKKSVINRYKIEAIIVGSDQVWRPYYNRYICDMFLQFVQKKKIIKIAYAASFGVDYWEYSEKLTTRCKHLIKQFDAVSVREISGISLCQNNLDREAVCVLDPTLLISKDHYHDLCRDVPRNGNKKLMLYLLDITEEIVECVNHIAKEKQLDVDLFSADDNISLSIEQWISKFRDAQFVITDSFHGTVFSIIFEKDFISIANKDRGSARFKSLLSQLNLGDRLIPDLMKFNINSTINWLDVECKKNELRRSSSQFIENNIKYYHG